MTFLKSRIIQGKAPKGLTLYDRSRAIEGQAVLLMVI